MSSPTAAATTTPQDVGESLASQHRLKLKPPSYDGNYTTFDDWHYKFKAYMGVQHNFYSQFLPRAIQSTTRLTAADLTGAAANQQEADEWLQLDHNLKYVLVITTTAAAATLCRQYQHEIGLEIYRQLHLRFKTPIGTRSIGYLTKLLEPTFDNNNFEESFSNWEYDIQQYESDNSTALPDQVKVAVLMNRTRGPLQQHLHLNAGQSPTYAEIRTTITEYQRAHTTFSRLQQNQSSAVSTNYNGGAAPMDIGAISKGKYKGRGKGKYKGKKRKKGNKGKGYGSYGHHAQGNYNTQSTGKGKGKIGQGMPFKGQQDKGKGKSYGKTTGQGKGHIVCYKCGQPGHTMKNCRVSVYNINEDTQNNEQNVDTTQQWYEQSNNYDSHWWNNDQSPSHHQQQVVTSEQASSSTTVPLISIAAIRIASTSTAAQALQHDNKNDLMVDSGAVTHVCPPWFSTETTLHELRQSETPNLRTATDDAIKVYGYKWVYMTNNNNQAIVIPFYVCDVAQPILSATRLAEQGFEITLSEQPRIKHTNGFESTLKQQHGLYYLSVKTTGTPINTRLDVAETEQGIKATISPVTMTPTGAKWVTHNNDVWMYNSQGFLVRLHKRQRQTTYIPDKQCPVPMDKLEDYRRTIAHRRDGTTEDFEEQLHSLQPTQARMTLDGQPWTGETWFKVKPDFKPPRPTLTKQASTRTDPTGSKETQQSTAPATRHTYKKPIDKTTTTLTQSADTATGIPHPKNIQNTTGDYWIKEGHLWKRVHQQVRTDLYIPQQTHDGPDVTQLGPERMTMVKPTNGNRPYRLDDDWTTKTKATLNIPWTGSTNFEEQVSYKDEYFTIEEEEQQQAVPAKGLKSPDQPTPQERAEHNLTHLPFRSWCKQCVQNKSKADAHPKQQRNSRAPVVQFDFCYFKSLGEQKTTPILTGIDVETGMAMAVVVSNKTQDFNYHVQRIQSFLMECGRVQAVLSNTVVQSDQEEHLISLLKATATKLGNNITVRQSPAYSSQSQGSVERFHRTLMGQVRTLKAQLEANYDISITSQHPIIPWLVRHAVYLLNRYATHADGNTSFYRRWNKQHRTPLCEFGETVLYQLPNVKDLPKLENRFLPAIWLGKDTASGETLLGIATKVIRARTIKRQPMPEKHNRQLMDIINNSGLNKFPTAGTAIPLPATYKPPQRTPKESAAASTQTTGGQTTVQQQLQPPQLPIVDSPMATAPTHQHQRPALPSPKRTLPDEVAEGSSSKQTRRQEAPTSLTRPEATAEPATTRQRITAITVKTNKGQEITACSSEDTNEHITEMILLEPIINDTEGLDKHLTTQGMKKEIQQMKQQNVYTEVHIDTLAPEQRKNIIQSRWVLRNKGTEVRARIVAKGFTEPVTDIDNIYASTPIYSVLRLLLTISMNNNWTVRTGDISVAFLHAAAATDDLYMHPPTEFYNESDGIVWKLNKAIYGLRSSPKAWQTHLADVLQQLGLQRSTAEPNIYYTQQRSAYILVYVDDLLLLGDEEVTNKIFAAIQQHLLLRPTGTLTVGNTVSFLGRNITNKGDYYELGLSDSYNNTLLEEAGMESCKAATAPGTSALKTPTADHDQQLSEEEHKAFRRAVGKLQWMTYTRPDICYATKELARALQQPTSADQQKLKHLLRYIKGTTRYKQVIRPTVKLTQTTYDLNIYVDSDWAGCAETRKSTTGFSITFLGATITYGSRTQATIALSSAEAELYAINTGATEALHLQNLLTDLLNSNKANIKIHTDSSSGKSIATRIGTGEKTKHVELKHLFIQQLVALNHLRIIKIHTNDNPADIFTKYVTAETLQRHLHSVGLHIQHYPHSSF